MAKYNAIVTFHPFEAKIIKQYFKNTEIILYKNLTTNCINDKLFLGICAGNPEKTKIGEIVIIKSVIHNSKLINLQSTLLDQYLPFPQVETISSLSPLFVGEKFNATVYEMEAYPIIAKYGTNLNMIRIVTDFGIEKMNFNLSEYKNRIFPIFNNSMSIVYKYLKDYF